MGTISKNHILYTIDFGTPHRCSPDNPDPTETTPDGGDRTVPEINNSWDCVRHNPFAVGIYSLGNVIQKETLDVCRRY